MTGSSGGAEAEEEGTGFVSPLVCHTTSRCTVPQTSCHDALHQHTPALRQGEPRGHGDGKP